jgi:hypothetical protein
VALTAGIEYEPTRRRVTSAIEASCTSEANAMINTPLPDDWDQVLDRFAQTLDGVKRTLAKAAAWESPSGVAARADAYSALFAEHAPKHQELGHKATEITQWVDAIESELRVSEDLLRVLLTQTETVRQRLATWAGRAIG